MAPSGSTRVTVGVGLGVELHTVGTGSGGSTDLLRVGIYEYRRANACLLKPLYQGGKEIGMFGHGPSAARGQGSGGVGHKCHLGGAHLEYEVYKLVGGIALDIKLAFEQRPEFVHVAATYVAFVGTRMHRYAVGTEALNVEGDGLYIGPVLASGIAQSCYFIYINA